MSDATKPANCCQQARLTALADARWAALHAGSAADLAGIVDSLIHQTKENKMTEHSFISSSGNTLHLDGFGNLCIDEDVALEKGDLEPVSEFFQHERDQQLGRVRWPENPDIVIYRNEDGDAQGVGRSIFVIDESTGNNEPFYEHLVDKPAYEFEQAAHWYFTEGPGKKPERPWEDAQPGEVWRLTVDDEEMTLMRGRNAFVGDRYYLNTEYDCITAGRKLVNADGSLAE